MAFDELKESVWQANMGLVRAGLVVLTWGNVSGADRAAGVMAIKPSGLPYDRLRAEDIVVVSLRTGAVIDGQLNPSSDTPTHLCLYRAFDRVGGVAHAHSAAATSWAQACREIPCFGTTHADHFYGPVPVTRALTEEELRGDYEESTGQAIVERFRQGRLNPEHVPAVLVCGHAPFAWGASAAKALENMIVLEEVARMALQSLALNPSLGPIAPGLLDRHFLRKHGPEAYYGQKSPPPKPV